MAPASRLALADPLADLEERKALVLLGVVGAVIAELTGTSQTLAFVIFGIGALLRFRTVLDNPKLTGKAIMVVVVGLACGMGSWAMAVFVTAFSWVPGLIRIRAAGSESDLMTEEDPKPVFGTVQSLLVSSECGLQSSSLYEDKGQMVFLLYIPSGIDPRQLEAEVRASLKKHHVSEIPVDVVSAGLICYCCERRPILRSGSGLRYCLGVRKICDSGYSDFRVALRVSGPKER